MMVGGGGEGREAGGGNLAAGSARGQVASVPTYCLGSGSVICELWQHLGSTSIWLYAARAASS